MRTVVGRHQPSVCCIPFPIPCIPYLLDAQFTSSLFFFTQRSHLLILFSVRNDGMLLGNSYIHRENHGRSCSTLVELNTLFRCVCLTKSHPVFLCHVLNRVLAWFLWQEAKLKEKLKGDNKDENEGQRVDDLRELITQLRLSPPSHKKEQKNQLASRIEVPNNDTFTMGTVTNETACGGAEEINADNKIANSYQGDDAPMRID